VQSVDAGGPETDWNLYICKKTTDKQLNMNHICVKIKYFICLLACHVTINRQRDDGHVIMLLNH